MEIFTTFDSIEPKENTIIADNKKSFLLESSKIIFKGKNNILFVENGVRIRKSAIVFCGDNAVVYLSSSNQEYYLELNANSNTCIFIGANCFINQRMTLVTSECQNIIIGEQSLFSFGIYMRTADPHLLYDCKTKQRLNYSRSVLIGDHIWMGQNALILKGAIIGSGSVVGANSVVSGKKYFSNEVLAGNPAKVIKKDVFFSPLCVHSWTDELTDQYKTMETDDYIFSPSENTIDFEKLDRDIKKAATSNEKLKILLDTIVSNKDKNRFAIKQPEVPEKRKTFWNIFNRKQNYNHKNQ